MDLHLLHRQPDPVLTQHKVPVWHSQPGNACKHELLLLAAQLGLCGSQTPGLGISVLPDLSQRARRASLLPGKTAKCFKEIVYDLKNCSPMQVREAAAENGVRGRRGNTSTQMVLAQDARRGAGGRQGVSHLPKAPQKAFLTLPPAASSNPTLYCEAQVRSAIQGKLDIPEPGNFPAKATALRKNSCSSCLGSANSEGERSQDSRS